MNGSLMRKKKGHAFNEKIKGFSFVFSGMIK